MSVATAIKLINPNANFVVEDNDVTKITWSAGTTPISQSDINAKLSEADALDSEKFTKKQTNRTNAITVNITTTATLTCTIALPTQKSNFYLGVTLMGFGESKLPD